MCVPHRYALSHVYFTQEKYSFAESYASKALAINKCSSIACTQVALVSGHLGVWKHDSLCFIGMLTNMLCNACTCVHMCAHACIITPHSHACTHMHTHPHTQAQFHRQHYPEALATLNKAISINPSNPIPKFHRAKVLEILHRPEEALQQLDQLRISWPKEPNLYVTKGKVGTYTMIDMAGNNNR